MFVVFLDWSLNKITFWLATNTSTINLINFAFYTDFPCVHCTTNGNLAFNNVVMHIFSFSFSEEKNHICNNSRKMISFPCDHFSTGFTLRNVLVISRHNSFRAQLLFWKLAERYCIWWRDSSQREREQSIFTPTSKRSTINCDARKEKIWSWNADQIKSFDLPRNLRWGDHNDKDAQRGEVSLSHVDIVLYVYKLHLLV